MSKSSEKKAKKREARKQKQEEQKARDYEPRGGSKYSKKTEERRS